MKISKIKEICLGKWSCKAHDCEDYPKTDDNLCSFCEENGVWDYSQGGSPEITADIKSLGL